MWWNTLGLALREIRRNLLRSFLTILGIVIGVSAVITMVTLGRGATQAVQDQISSMGSNLLMVLPGQRLGPASGGAGAPAFKEADGEAIATQIGGVRLVAPEVRSSTVVVADGRNWQTAVIGSTGDDFSVTGWQLAFFQDASWGEALTARSQGLRLMLTMPAGPGGSGVLTLDWVGPRVSGHAP